MITAVKPVTFQFTADGTSTVFVFDLSTLPTNLDMRGAIPAGIQGFAVLINNAAPLAGVSPTIEGSVLTLTFNAAPPQNDNTDALILYTVNLLLQLKSLAPPA